MIQRLFSTNSTATRARRARLRVKRDARSHAPTAPSKVDPTTSIRSASGKGARRYAGNQGDTTVGSDSNPPQAGCPPHAYGFQKGNWWNRRMVLATRYRWVSI